MAGTSGSIRRASVGRAACGAAFAVVGVFLLVPGVAQATTHTVNNLSDSALTPGSLRKAINDANFSPGLNDAIQITVTGTLVLGSQLPAIDDNVVIQGPGANQFNVSGNASSKIFVVNAGRVVSISGLTIANGRVASPTSVAASGGGIDNNGTLTLDGVNVSGNVASATNSTGNATASGAGIHNSSSGTLTIRGSTVNANTAAANASGSASASGAGIYNSGTLSIELSTVSANTALAASTSAGGGIFQAGPALTVTSTTLTSNQATASANFGAGTGQSGIFRNTIFANATTPQGAGTTNCGGALFVSSGGYNLEDANTCGLTQSTDLVNTNPRLGPLANNGGPTLTHALLSGSPAIDAGNSFGETSDQRGLRRPVDFPWVPNAAGGDGADIGAFEVQGAGGTASLRASKKRVRKKQKVKLMATVPCGGMPRAVQFFRGGRLLATRLVGTVKDPDCMAGVKVKVRRSSTFYAVAPALVPYPQQISNLVRVRVKRRH